MIVGAENLLLSTTEAPTDFIHKYSWDNISGTTLVDEGSDPVNGTINAGITIGVKGVDGNAAYFNGGDAANVNVTGHNFWTGAFTFAVPVFYDPANSGVSIYTAGTSSGLASERSFDVFVRSGNIGFGVILSNGTSYLVVATSSNPVPENEWFYVVVKWDGTTTTNGLTVKINDTIDVQATVSAGTPSTGFTPRIGGFQSGDTDEWLGLQDEMLIFDRVTTDAEDTALYNYYLGFSGVEAGVPIPVDDNVIYELDTSTATGWSGSAMSSDGTDLTFDVSVATNSLLSIDGPTFGDFIMYLTISAENTLGSGVNYLLGAAGDPRITVSLGYNWETATYQTNRVSARFGTTGVQGPIIDFSANQVEVALQYDSRVGAGNFFVKESGVWVFYGAASMASPYIDSLYVTAGGGQVNDGYIHEWFIAHPNYMAIGDSITAGHNFFDPDPSFYAGDDDYTNTWMYYANLGAGLRNNLIVNYGIGSQNSEDISQRIGNAIMKTQARTVFLHLSSNDFGAGFTDEQRVTFNQNSIDIAKRFEDTQVVFLNCVYPNEGSGNYPASSDSYRAWWADHRDELVRTSSKLDIMGGSGILDGNYMNEIYTESDSVHPNNAGYELIGNYIESQE